jgi:23S rRNA maturation mini-RNase III
LKSTPQQLAAATERYEALKASKEKSKKKSPHTTTIVHNEFKPLTEAEHNALKRGRAAAIEESMVRQVRPEECELSCLFNIMFSEVTNVVLFVIF